MDSKWDKRFLDLARHVSAWSKDPSTKVGCVLVDDNKCVLGIGYNGFPHGVEDSLERLHDRPTKYKLVVHAEANAILNARTSLKGTTVYTYPLPPCVDCMKLLAQAGVKRVLYPTPDEASRERWGDSWELAEAICEEVGIDMVEL